MIKHVYIAFILCQFAFAQKPTIKLKQIATGFMAPVAMDSPKDGSKRLFICEQTGKIKIIKNGTVMPTPFLDIANVLDDVNKVYSEKGLLGIAFHPNYKSNGRFFIYYSATSANKYDDHQSIVAEFKVSSNPDVANAGSQQVILRIDQPESNHNGGQLAFGPDGMLYIGSGDGGGAGDQHGAIGNGQDKTTLLGKILRINIDGKKPYEIPKDNPFIGQKDVKQEIWAYGLRNPWRFSFDRKSGKLFCADVGQDKWEEIDLIEKGKNYGWRVMEGNHCYQKNCNPAGLTAPIAEYDHKMGISVTGGYVYRGTKMTAWTGKYIFGDWKGNMYYLQESGTAWTLNPLSIEGKKDNDAGTNINSFGEDENGEIYMLTQKMTSNFKATGIVYLIEQAK